MVAVSALHPQRVSRSETQHPGLTEALDNYFKAGWGQTYRTTYLAPSLPRPCSSTEVEKLCPWVQCDYGDPDGNTSYSWVHFDIEAAIEAQ